MSEATLEIKGLVIRAEGEESMRAAFQALSSVLEGLLPAGDKQPPALPEPVEEPEPAPKRIVKRRKKRETVAVEGEPDGFNAPDPPPATPTFVLDRKQKTQPLDDGTKKVGALAAKIIGVLDRGSGVAHIDELIRQCGGNAHGIALAAAKCDRLQRLSNGRIALTGYRDED